MTSLQLLSCNASPFRIKSEHGLMQFITSKVKPACCSLSRKEAIRKEKQRYKSALDLAKFLITKDTSWEATYPGLEQSKPKPHKYGFNLQASSDGKKKEEGHSTASLHQEERGGEGDKTHKPSSSEKGGEDPQRDNKTHIMSIGETPLFLATKSGCIEIVRQILKFYPQAVEYIDDDGRNILHVAIKYRQLKIFKLVKQMEVPMRRLVRKVDNHGNTILHTVGVPRRDYVPAKMQGPALQLQEELLWFEMLMGYLAAQCKLRKEGQRMAKGPPQKDAPLSQFSLLQCFAAAYTYRRTNQNTGFPVSSINLFVVFTVADVLSLHSLWDSGGYIPLNLHHFD
ncbi:hypothetical protein L1049_005500 [Liquidambar formosana]|uniref:Uncharacterized protein n=1 Tax=Liquidambar formosana TaxID=63359 RepID=A0AAP0QYW6_LIQFO